MDFHVDDQASPFLNRLLDQIQPERLAKSLVTPLVQFTQDHIAKLEETHPNKQGFPSTHFWGQSAKSTHGEVNGSTVSVSISKIGFAQRYFGGPIDPVNVKWLTIPACAEAYGHRASEFDFLHIGFTTRDGVRTPSTLEMNPMTPFRKSGGKRILKNARSYGGKVFYWLVKHVEQTGDNSILPSESEYMAFIEGEAYKRIGVDFQI